VSEFNAKAARTKRPLPLWVDAFHRDTQDLSAEEVGAYFLLLTAMWTRESCDLPDDDVRLARVCRVSLAQWKRGIGPVMRTFLTAEGGTVFSKRLKKEAEFTEISATQQSQRRSGKSRDNSLKNKEADQSADYLRIDPQINGGLSVDQPTQLPNNPTYKDDVDDDAGAKIGISPDGVASDRERILTAIGVGPDGVIGPSRFIGGQGDMAEAARWLALPGITIDRACDLIREVMARKAGGPPARFSYFTAAMRKLSGQLTAPQLHPETPGTPGMGARASPRPTASEIIARIQAADAAKDANQ
jgi:uncharacterized protein YdaU (DUF1376 family)